MLEPLRIPSRESPARRFCERRCRRIAPTRNRLARRDCRAGTTEITRSSNGSGASAHLDLLGSYYRQVANNDCEQATEQGYKDGKNRWVTLATPLRADISGREARSKRSLRRLSRVGPFPSTANIVIDCADLTASGVKRQHDRYPRHRISRIVWTEILAGEPLHTRTHASSSSCRSRSLKSTDRIAAAAQTFAIVLEDEADGRLRFSRPHRSTARS